MQVPNNAPAQVLSFVRANDKDKVFVALNLSDKPVKASFDKTLHHGSYRDFATGAKVEVGGSLDVEMAPWSYRVLVK